MNDRKPISYLQTDPRWKNNNYSAAGERKTIGSSGCGPTAAAMVIATLKDKSVTPAETAEWSMAHGYKAFNQGTYYSYFLPQFSQYGIAAERLNYSSVYGQTASAAHTKAQNALKQGDWIIACMGKGNWTTSGHFILVYAYENGTVFINDPASTAASRIKNAWSVFAPQAKYLWTISVPDGFKEAAADTSAGASADISVEKPADTVYDKRTFIREIQAATGAKIDGIAGPETLSKTVTISRSKNNRHAAVKPLQLYLNALGYACGAPDGIAGAKFDAAVKAYQRDHSCVVDGELTAGKRTWKSLLFETK